MIYTQTLPCHLDRELADSLNRESGRIYTDVLVWHWRALRRSGHWVSPFASMKWADWRDKESSALLHSHSVDAAQEGFAKACKTAKANKGDGSHYPRKRKFYRTTTWKSKGIRYRDGLLLLSLARGKEPIKLPLPENLQNIKIQQVELVYVTASSSYEWHFTIEDGNLPELATGNNIAAIDLGEIHPAVATDGEEAVVFSCREIRSIKQNTNRKLASINSKMSKMEKGSKRYKKLKKRKSKFLSKQDKRSRDLEHKVSHAIVSWAKERKVGTLVIGDVRNIADNTKNKKRLGRTSRQKISDWTHGKLRKYIGYKAKYAGISVDDKVSEYYSTQTCPQCGQRYKPKGRTYSCNACGFVGHRDIVGAINILSKFTMGEVGLIQPPKDIKYLRPFQRWKVRSSPLDTGQVARESENPPEFIPCGVSHNDDVISLAREY